MIEANNSYFPGKTVIRIDDISINSNKENLHKLLEIIRNHYQNVIILLAVSPMVFDMQKYNTDSSEITERVFPKILNAYSDFRVYYDVEKLGIPDWLDEIVNKYECELATHGLIHVDHRFLNKDLQEFSIRISASLLSSKIFVPPFNKYNLDTINVCAENRIQLVKWEDGWKHLAYNKFNDDNKKYYVHTHDFSYEKLFEIFK